MDFFGQQERARRRSGRLVVLFLLAVVCIILAIHFLVVALFAGAEATQVRAGVAQPFSWWQLDVLAGVAFVTALVVAGAALFKIAALRGGGRRIAEQLGGREVAPATTDPREKQLLNVVEEVAIASGVAVPPVYVLEGEGSINAFAAGYGPTDAVVAVTRGTLEQLNRDELQGVVAHEFSHILNGDMRLNIRLIGVLFGITCISTAGYVLLRTFGRSRSGKGGAGGIALFGLGLLVIGWIGSLFASMIRAAVSRQREFLADASAVQFTRLPDGIGGALRKIAGFPTRSLLRSAHAADCSHMFFGSALHRSFMNLFATHPPLEERIRAIDPSFDPRRERRAAEAETGAEAEAPRRASAAAFSSLRGGAALAVTPEAVAGSVGQPGPAHLSYAAALIANLDPALAEMVRDGAGARATAYALLLDERPDVHARQLALVEREDAPAADLARRAARAFALLDRADRLPLLDLALPALKSGGAEAYHTLRRVVTALIGADQQVTLFEYALERVLFRHLRAAFEAPPPRRVKHRDLRTLSAECRTVLSALAHAGAGEAAAVETAYDHGSARIEWAGTRGAPALLPAGECSPERLSPALDEIDRAAPQAKGRFVAACAATVSVDGKVTAREAELLRAVVESIDCPMPPLLEETVGA
ncbi:MAG: M48 family metallopeptidase [Planctomycetes bacterium]|nr:M48 family metallopeptidase [Planctomycetota bacterium]